MGSKRQVFTFYAGREVKVGVELSEGFKQLQTPGASEGRVVARFFNTSQPKDTQIRYTMEPAEAFRLYLLIQRIYRSQGPAKEKLPPHKFTKDGKEVMTTVSVEKWARNGKSGYALSVSRGNNSHNVSLSEADFLYAGEVLRNLSVSSNWQVVPTPPPTHPTQRTKQEAIAALTTLKLFLGNSAVPRLRPLYDEIDQRR